MPLLIALTAGAFSSGCRSETPTFSSEPEFGRVAKSNSQTNAPILQIEVYRFKVGDIVTVTAPHVVGAYNLRIAKEGTITLPSLGVFVAAGKTPGELRNDLTIRDPQHHSFTVKNCGCELFYYVAGEVLSPGPKPYIDAITVSEAIQAAGGLTAYARTNRVTLTRANGKRERVKLGSGLSDPQIYPGDSITVPRAGIF
jgi:protein involved in polysaccharide export with SLBB domain